MKKFFSFIFLSLSFNAAYSLEEDKILPEPLSFQSALEFAAYNYHYSFLNAKAAIELVRANDSINSANNDLDINLKGYVRQAGISALADKFKDKDHKISLVVKKSLYDFGLSASKEKQFDTLIRVKEAELELKKEEYINDVIEAYFQVLRADNQYLADNENMSIAYIRFNRAQENAEFGLTSDLDILEAQSNYEQVRQQRYFSEDQQRFTRQVLAELLGSSTLPDQLETPNINTRRIIIDDVSKLIDLALKNSKNIQLKYLKLDASKQGLNIASSVISPNIDVEFQLNDYKYDTPTRDEWRASINFNIPLYSGDRSTSASQSASAKYHSTLSELQQAQSSLRIKVLKLWQRIKQKTVEFQGAKIKQEYRDLYLEQSRANYELEYKSDLGDSMVQFSRSRAERFSIEFDLEIAWRELISLVGNKNINKILIQKIQKPTEDK